MREAIDERDDLTAQEWLIDGCGLDRAGAEQAVAYVRAGKAILGVVPTDRTVVAERFFDEVSDQPKTLRPTSSANVLPRLCGS